MKYVALILKDICIYQIIKLREHGQNNSLCGYNSNNNYISHKSNINDYLNLTYFKQKVCFKNWNSVVAWPNLS